MLKSISENVIGFNTFAIGKWEKKNFAKVVDSFMTLEGGDSGK